MHLWPRCWRQGLGLTALTLLLALSAPALAATADSPFELDANPQDDVPVANSDDWDTPPNSGGATKFTGIIQDKAPLTSHAGGDKDILDIDKWGWSDGQVPDKNDLTHAYAAAYNEDNDLLLYFGADRFANDGDAFMGFWFFKQTIAALPNGKFSGKHSPGDTLILINFPQSANSHPYMAVVQWDTTCSKAASNDPSPGQCAAANLRLLDEGSGDNNQVCTSSSSSGGKLACALTNTGDVPVPGSTLANGVSGLWSDYTPKSGTKGIFPSESFFEGGINLTKILEDAAGGSIDGCFSSFMAETRASSSFTAALKDFVLSEFELCGVEVTKTCSGGEVVTSENGVVSIEYDISGAVDNTGFGTLYNVRLYEDNGTGTFSTTPFKTITSIASDDAPVPYTGTFTSAGNGPKNKVKVVANTSSGPTATTVEDIVEAQCPIVTLSASMSITKSCVAKVELQPAAGTTPPKLAVRVYFEGKVCNTTSGASRFPLTNVKVYERDLDGSNTAEREVLSLAKLDPADPTDPTKDGCVPYTGDYYPTNAATDGATNLTFHDRVRTTADAPFGLDSPSDTVDASCPLCVCPECNK